MEQSSQYADGLQKSFALQVLEAKEATGRLKPDDVKKLAQLRSDLHPAIPTEQHLPPTRSGVVGPDEDRASGHGKHPSHSINGNQGLDPTSLNRTPGPFHNRDNKHP